MRQKISHEFMHNRNHLLSFISGIIRNAHDAEDIFQEVWIRLDKAIEMNKPIDDVQRWSRSTAKNLILHYWRDKRRKGVVVDSELLNLIEQAFVENDEKTEYWNERSFALQDCMSKLSTKMRDLLSMKYEKSMKFKAIAEAQQKSIDSIKMSVSRIRAKLRECTQSNMSLSEPVSDG